MWTEKYSAKTINEFINKEKAIQLRKYIIDKEKLIIVHGKTGLGKTTSIHKLADELNYEIIELNSSNLRNKDAIERILIEASQQISLFRTGKLILIDEIDNLSGTKDRGAIPTILELAKSTRYPIILTLNDLYNDKISNIRKKAKIIEFEKPNFAQIYDLLKSICDKEKISYTETELKQLARQHVDIRAAINDLQILTTDKKLILSDIHERDTTDSIMNVLSLIFKSKETAIISKKIENLDLDELRLWIEENLPLEYEGEDLINAYEMLSKSDVFKGRIIRQQYWRFLVYQNFLLTSGIALSKKDKTNSFIAYKRNSRLLKIWINNNKNIKKKSIVKKIASRTHDSAKNIKENFVYLKTIIAKNNINFNFTEEELDYLK